MPAITLTDRDSQSLAFIKGADHKIQGYLIISKEMFATFFNPFQTKQQYARLQLLLERNTKYIIYATGYAICA